MTRSNFWNTKSSSLVQRFPRPTQTPATRRGASSSRASIHVICSHRSEQDGRRTKARRPGRRRPGRRCGLRMTPNWSRKPSPPGWPCKAHRRRTLRRKNLGPPQSIQILPNCPWHQRTPPNGQGGRPRKVKAPIDAAEPSLIPSVSVVADNPVLPSTQPQADAAPAKIQKSELTISEPRRHRDKPTSNSWHRSLAWSAGEAPLTPTTCGSPGSARWDAR
jgi:hypothetical protein